MGMRKKLLIVDDDQDLLRGMVVRLKASGYDVACASDGVMAVSMARSEKPNLILLDIGLPGGDGYVVMDRLRVMGSLMPTPIIVLSAKDPLTHREKAIQAGAEAFFQKPVDNSILIAAIQRALGDTEEVRQTA
jgi:DNA-binding response OmpR family regulator